MYDQNNLSQLNFKLKLPSLNELEMRAQSVVIPGLNLGQAPVPTPFVRISEPGNIEYSDLQVTFMIGENLKDYLEIYNWMVQLGHPDRLDQYRHKVIDGSVLILNSSMNPIVNVRFTDLFPISLSDLNFDSTLSEIQYATATVSFRFTRFYFDAINS
jgi:hypothetical protein